MNKQMTVIRLLQLCQQEVQNGNGNKVIVISDDNEGNGYHGLFYGFTKDVSGFVDYIYDSCDESGKNTIILG